MIIKGVFLKKIGILVSRIDKGAAELLEINLAKNLTKQGYNVYLITMYSSKPFDDYEIELKLTNEILHIIRLGYDFKRNPILLLKNILRVKKLKLDCLISHNQGTDLFSFIISFGTPTKHIKAFHEYYEKSHQVSYINKIWSFVVKNADFSYHITQHSLIKNSETFNLDKTKTSVVQNVLDIDIKETSTFEIRKVCKIPKKSKIILTVARVVPNKGIELNIEIVIPLLKKDKQLYYIIAGDTDLDVKYYDKLLTLVHNNDLQKQILFIGFQNNIFELMRGSDVLLHFARHEAFGLTLIEALSAKLPIVSSDVGGIPDVLQKSSFKTFSLEALDQARKEVHKYIYEQNKANNNFSSDFDSRTSEERAKEISEIIEKVCIQ